MKWIDSHRDVAKNSLALVVILVVSVLGVRLLMASSAAAGASLSLTTSATSVTPGSTIAVTIREDSGTDAINSVQASLNYDAAQLQYVSMTEGTAFPTIAANSTATSGVLRVGRATSTPVTGGNDVVTVNFKVLAASGTIDLSYDKNYSFVVRSSDNTDVLSSTTGLNLIVAGNTTASASLSLAPSSITAASGSTVTVAVRENSATTSVKSVQASVGFDAAKLQYVGMSEGNTFTAATATDTSVPGKINLTRSLPSGSLGVSGDNPVVTLSFKVVANSGQATLSVDKVQSKVLASSNGADILTTVSDSTVTVTAAPTTSAVLSLAPASGSFVSGSDVSVVINVNSGGSAVSTVESVINYPASQLQYVSTTEGGVFTTALRTRTTTSGVVDIIRGISGGSAGITGINPVVTLNFKVIGTSGAAALTYGAGSAVYDDTGSGTSILDIPSSATAQYTVTAPVVSCTTNPSTPGIATKTNNSYTSIALSWTASTPGANCALTGYHVYRGGAVVGDVTSGTTFTDSGLASGAAYIYTVKAFDSTGHTSAASPAASLATKADDQSPTTPLGVTAAAPDAVSIDIAWNPSTDFPNPGGVGVAGYHVYRNNDATPTYDVKTGTTFTDTNVASNTTYSYIIKSYDLVGNESAGSNIVSAKTAPATVSCTGSPSTPTGLKPGNKSTTTASLSWTDSTASAGCTLAGYRIYRDGNFVGTTTGTGYNDTGLTPNTQYTYTVRAYDTDAHQSTVSTALVISTDPDTTAPDAPTNVTATAVSSGQVRINWTGSTDSISSISYRLYRGGSLIRTLSAPATTYSDTLVNENTDYNYALSAVDVAGNESTRTAAVPSPVHTPLSADNQAPTAPTAVHSLAVTTDSVIIGWNASTDARGVAGYHVYRGGQFIGDATGLAYSDSGLSEFTSYTYTVKAYDASGNVSAASAALTATTLQNTTNVVIGDFNGDNVVNLYDLSVMMTHWQDINVPVKFGDIDQDGVVNDADLTILLSHLGDKS